MDGKISLLDIRLLDILIVLAEGKKFLIGCT